MSAPLNVKSLAELLGVSADWVYTQVEAGAIPCTRLPGKSVTGARRLIRFTPAHVEQILSTGEQPVVNAPTLSLAKARAQRRTRAA
jgi:predicted DNA-binding transcriptional regulator AlpA